MSLGDDYMRFIATLGSIALVTLLVTGCGSDRGNGKTDTGVDKKPTLEVTVNVSGDAATIHIKTDLNISKNDYGKERKVGEGHIHMSLDSGEKSMLTDINPVLSNLSAGKHNVNVSLHNNDHTPYDVSTTVDFEVK
jgi:hypothetical protein